jgi:hypothetical protein
MIEQMLNQKTGASSMLTKVYYDGDASKIIGERLILELIQEKKIKIVNNKLLFHALYNKGTTRTSSPIYVLGGQWHDSMYKKAFEGSWIYVDDKGILRIDYDNETLEKMLRTSYEDLADDGMLEAFKKGIVENDNRTS